METHKPIDPNTNNKKKNHTCSFSFKTKFSFTYYLRSLFQSFKEATNDTRISHFDSFAWLHQNQKVIQI